MDISIYKGQQWNRFLVLCGHIAYLAFLHGKPVIDLFIRKEKLVSPDARGLVVGGHDDDDRCHVGAPPL
jgi:hypothetical protein